MYILEKGKKKYFGWWEGVMDFCTLYTEERFSHLEGDAVPTLGGRIGEACLVLLQEGTDKLKWRQSKIS